MKINKFGLVAIAFFSLCSSLSYSAWNPDREIFNSVGGYMIPPLMDHRTIVTFEQIQKDRSQFSNYEEFLAYLKKESPQLFLNYVLIHTSQSIQPATPRHPRVVYFGGGSFFAFSEAHEGPERKVEIIEVSPVDFKTSFREIRFEGHGKLTFNAQPKSCIACHGESGKLIWESYPFWPQAYGSVEGGSFAGEKKEENAFLSIERKGAIPEIHQTFHEFALLNNNVMTRYSQNMHLARWMKNTIKTMAQKKHPLTYAVLARTICAWVPDAELPDVLPSDFATTAKVNLGQLLDKAKEDEVLAFNLLGGQLNSTFPVREDWLKAVHQALIRDSGVGEHWRVNAERQFLLEQFNIPLKELTFSYIENRYNVNSVTNGFAYEGQRILPILVPEVLDLELRDDDFGMFCPRLAARSRKALANVKAEDLYKIEMPPTVGSKEGVSPISRCITCHSEATHADRPLIPFENPRKLRALLIENPELKTLIEKRIHTTGKKQRFSINDRGSQGIC